MRYGETAESLVFYMPSRPVIGWIAAVLIAAVLLVCLGFIGLVGYHLGWLFLPIGLFLGAIALLVLGALFLAFTQRYLATTFVDITRERLVLKIILWGREQIKTHKLREHSVARLYWGDPRLLRRGHTPRRPQGVELVVEGGRVNSSPVFGDALSWGEQDWIVWRINSFLGGASDADAQEPALRTPDTAPVAITGLPSEPLPPPEGILVHFEEDVSGTRIVFPNTMQTGSRRGAGSVVVGAVWAAGSLFYMLELRQEELGGMLILGAFGGVGLLVTLASLARLFGRSRLTITPERITFRMTLLGIGPWTTLPMSDVISVQGNAIRTAGKQISLHHQLRDAVREQAELDWLMGEIALRIQAARTGTLVPPVHRRRRQQPVRQADAIREPPTGTVPYDVHLRPRPSGNDLNTLLPAQVGPFRREPFEAIGQAGSGPIYVEYGSDEGEVFVEFGICPDSHDACNAVVVAQAEAYEPGAAEDFSPKTEPSFYRMVAPNGAFMAWSRGNYFFSASVHGAGGEPTLGRFMDAFPY